MRFLALAIGLVPISGWAATAHAHVVPGLPHAHGPELPDGPGLPAGQAARAMTVSADDGQSPAVCGDGDNPEPGIQGEVPRGATADYSCGLTLVSTLPVAGPVQASGHCLYVRTGGSLYGNGSVIRVFDMTDPVNPVQVGDPLPTYLQSETMRAVTTDDRAVLVQGGAVYDIRDCEHPVLKGHIEWNPNGARAPLKDAMPRSIAHDIRISPDATKVYASYSLVVADISNLEDSSTWTVEDQTCEISAQYHPVWSQSAVAANDNQVCEEVWRVGETPQISGQQSHAGPEENADGTRLYIGSQLPANDGNPSERDATLRILDITGETPEIKAEIEGPGHSVDWFRTADGREWVLHANEIAAGPTSCLQHPRPSSVGFAHEAYLTEVTGDTLKRASLVEMAISKPENCAAKVASGRGTSMAYHSVDDRNAARFAMIPFGDAGLRIIDIRDPYAPVEVAYFNHGSLDHAGVSHYDADRGLIYAPVSGGVRVLQLQPQVRDRLGLA